MTKDEILAKVKEREFEQRCAAVGICPGCGDKLKVVGDDHFLDQVCKPCNLTFALV